MGFLRDLTGGVLIMLVATAVGAVQNSLRAKPLPLWVDVPRSASVDPSGAGALPEGTSGARGDEDASRQGLAGPKTAGDSIGREELREELEAGGVILIDVRSEGEFNEGHIPGAMNIPYENITEYFQRLTDNVPLTSAVVCYCRSVTCDLSDRLAQELRLMGYDNVRLFRGGWEEWQEAGYPVENP
jgi:rhodanese-related sulfurtransferase